MKKRIIISLGGSIIIPKTGFDPVFLKSLKSLFVSEVKKGNQFILIVGGGATSRMYQDALRVVGKPTNTDLDWMGVETTKVNAMFVKLLFGDIAYKEILSDPRKKVNTSAPVIIASGWKPGNSTDYCAVNFAKTYGASDVINLSNIEYVYDKDPAKHKDAQKIEQISWKDFRTIVGNVWDPGANLPFDPIASKMAQKLGLRVSILRGTDLKEVKNAIAGKTFRGTVIY
ncbi:MAG: UMP kinase [Candidatus Magasanikbacteria bacterium CG10_big_fil_rev_8_21_14_0_10_42_10]|uniref:UMP kinase n=2 Tax=Candidatus Magasanikiibacteriota TaxID=1752731 RepID=A0A2H0TYB6_9BACT|nr:MAG: UMP kinase [Candidatus Magasanikbacteria bacterium CG10_big_fil_rev_8_21_14_0_10_42_10]PIZ93983.1 MAG: UMP kinase [Candidatus Magasanikbacteria bacterium CG_4_10_14_0_2_um_filter_41_10]